MLTVTHFLHDKRQGNQVDQNLAYFMYTCWLQLNHDICSTPTHQVYINLLFCSLQGFAIVMGITAAVWIIMLNGLNPYQKIVCLIADLFVPSMIYGGTMDPPKKVIRDLTWLSLSRLAVEYEQGGGSLRRSTVRMSLLHSGVILISMFLELVKKNEASTDLAIVLLT